MANQFQAPKGTRDFYPEEMAVRRYIEDVWRRVSIRHGFQEVDGPTFESLDLYKVKSGEEIVSQLFSFKDRGERDLALRPEFTPTLARMVVEKAASLPKPIKWFSIPRCYRAEQPQKGRLREFGQWNIDIIGDATDRADRECLAVCIDALLELGLKPDDFKIGWNHREILTKALVSTFVKPDHINDAYYILDKLPKLDKAGRKALYKRRGCSDEEEKYYDLIAEAIGTNIDAKERISYEMRIRKDWPRVVNDQIETIKANLESIGLGNFCRFDIGIVRGLAYYTGFVFEVTDAKGENRAIVGGGRYDELIKTFGGPSLPAIGFGMGDVVLEIVLYERGLLPDKLTPAPDVFIINALDGTKELEVLLKDFRRSKFDNSGKIIVRSGLFTQASYKATKNIGKLLQEAAASGARFAVILAPDEIGRGMVKLKDMDRRNEEDVPVADVVNKVHALLVG
ncbi:MAG TPA: histidine--tRNA ligase [Phycisphaerae bacterium]|nr:histidine--tRNA ligase [Phycisphaerae bacterium]